MKMIDLTMLGMVAGRERTAAEFEALLSANGCTTRGFVATGTDFTIIEATVD